MIDFIIGCYFFLLGWVMHTSDLKSFLILKVAPFASGIYLTIKTAKDLGWL